MTATRPRIAELSPAEVELLCLPANEDLRDTYLVGLSLLHGLLGHYARSGFSIQIPDEAEALGLFEQTLRELEGAQPYHERLARSIDAYWAVRWLAEEHGYPAGWDVVDALQDALTEQSGAIEHFPLWPKRHTRPLRSVAG